MHRRLRLKPEILVGGDTPGNLPCWPGIPPKQIDAARADFGGALSLELARSAMPES